MDLIIIQNENDIKIDDVSGYPITHNPQTSFSDNNQCLELVEVDSRRELQSPKEDKR